MRTRRQVLGMMAAGGAGLVLPSISRLLAAERRTTSEPVPPSTGASGRIVVVGGGMAGATAAKYLRLWGGVGVAVTLVEREPRYTSNILSNLVLTQQLEMTRLYFTHAALARNYGVKVVSGEVMAIDPVARRIDVASGSGRTALEYDRLVICTGVDFDVVPGLETAAAQNAIPHAWKAGEQTTNLRDQIAAMPAGGVFVMTIPSAPYRCPPGPYERACVVADHLKRTKGGSKVIVLDANASITAERETFTNAFEVTHRGVIEYVPNAAVLSVDAACRIVRTTMGDFPGNVVNVIPPHRATRLIAASGLANATNGRFAGVDVLSYESTAVSGIHVIGDASATSQPKAGHIANQEAKVCADAITRALRGQAPDPAPVTNSACFSPITRDTASWLTAIYAYDPASRTMKPVGGAATEARSASKDNYEDMFKWFNALMTETFV